MNSKKFTKKKMKKKEEDKIIINKKWKILRNFYKKSRIKKIKEMIIKMK